MMMELLCRSLPVGDERLRVVLAVQGGRKHRLKKLRDAFPSPAPLTLDLRRHVENEPYRNCLVTDPKVKVDGQFVIEWRSPIEWIKHEVFFGGKACGFDRVPDKVPLVRTSIAESRRAVKMHAELCEGGKYAVGLGVSCRERRPAAPCNAHRTD